MFQLEILVFTSGALVNLSNLHVIQQWVMWQQCDQIVVEIFHHLIVL